MCKVGLKCNQSAQSLAVWGKRMCQTCHLMVKTRLKEITGPLEQQTIVEQSGWSEPLKNTCLSLFSISLLPSSLSLCSESCLMDTFLLSIVNGDRSKIDNSYIYALCSLSVKWSWGCFPLWLIDHVCFPGLSCRQINGTPQKGFVRPEQLLQGKVRYVWNVVSEWVSESEREREDSQMCLLLGLWGHLSVAVWVPVGAVHIQLC